MIWTRALLLVAAMGLAASAPRSDPHSELEAASPRVKLSKALLQSNDGGQRSALRPATTPLEFTYEPLIQYSFADSDCSGNALSAQFYSNECFPLSETEWARKACSPGE